MFDRSRVIKKREACALPIIFLAATLCRAACSAESPEDFDSFLPRFSNEKPFAIERTRLPLRVVKWDEAFDIDGRRITDPQKFDLSLAEYFRWPTLGEYIEKNHLQSQLNRQADAVRSLELFQQGNSLRVSYRFEVAEGCWFLTAYESKSI